MMPQYFTRYGNYIYAILNWRQRKTVETKIYAERLSPGEEDEYRRLQDLGSSDREIFEQLFPMPAHQNGIDFVKLISAGKEEIIRLLEGQLQVTLTSLRRMTKRDLLSLYIRLQRSESIHS